MIANESSQRSPWARFLTDEDQDLAGSRGPRYVRAPAIDSAHTALLLVDVYRSAFGELGLPPDELRAQWPSACGPAAWEALPQLVRLLVACRAASVRVIHITAMPGDLGLQRRTRDFSGRTGTPGPRLVRGYESMPEIHPAAGETMLYKAGPSAFSGTPLASQLVQGDISHVLVAGQVTSGCIRATVVDSFSAGFDTSVVVDCVFDRYQASHAMALFDMQDKYASLIDVATVVAKLAEVAVGQHGESDPA